MNRILFAAAMVAAFGVKVSAAQQTKAPAKQGPTKALPAPAASGPQSAVPAEETPVECLPAVQRAEACDQGLDQCLLIAEACQERPVSADVCQQNCPATGGSYDRATRPGRPCACPQGKRLEAASCRCVPRPPPPRVVVAEAPPPPPVITPIQQPPPAPPPATCPASCCSAEECANIATRMRRMLALISQLQDDLVARGDVPREEFDRRIQGLQEQLDALPDDIVGRAELDRQIRELRADLERQMEELRRRTFGRFTLFGTGAVLPHRDVGGVGFDLRLFQSAKDHLAFSMNAAGITDGEDLGGSASLLLEYLPNAPDSRVNWAIGIGPTITGIEEEPMGNAKYVFRGFALRPAVFIRPDGGAMIFIAAPLALGQWNRNRDREEPDFGASVGLQVGITVWGH